VAAVWHRARSPRLLEIPLRRGRTFTSADGPGSTEVAVVNETLARQRFGGADPIGRRLEDEPVPGAAPAGQANVE